MTDLRDREGFTYSIVIPVYNSEEIVGETVDRVVQTFTEAGLRHQVILVNDGQARLAVRRERIDELMSRDVA